MNEFVEKVVVHEAVKTDGVRTQDIDIFFAFIGRFELPAEEIPQKETPKLIGSRGRKLRRHMTEDELARAHEIDHMRYTQKVAAKKAAEQAERAAILQGTSYAQAV